MYRSLVGFGLAACVMYLSACSNDTRKSVMGDSIKLVRGNFKVGEVAQDCDSALEAAQKKLDAIATLPEPARTTDTTLLAFERATAELSDAALPLTFMGYVSTDEKLSAEGSECEQKLGQFSVGVFTRADLYAALKDVKPRNSDEARLLSETLKGFEKNGLKLAPEVLAQVKALKQKLTVLESTFSTNLNKDTTTVLYKPEELDGVPAIKVGSWPIDANGNRIVTTKAPDFQAIADNASNSETRRKMYDAYLNMAGKENTALLEQAVETRRQIAKLMGYGTWADYRIDGRMAKDGRTALEFLKGLKAKLSERTQKDLALFLARKQKDDPTATKLNEWDLRYYPNQLKKEVYNTDDEKIREYFPAEVVMKGVFEIYSQLLGVHFIEVLDAKVWAPGVKLYQIVDTKEGRLIGHFYTDFIPRDLKYDHFAAFPLIAAQRLPDGSYSKPVAAIVGNFNPAVEDRPSLLSHYEVTTLFHEFGHIMHQTLTTAPYASLSGSNTAQDFVEAPSQMLENWSWAGDILSRVSSHYKTGEKLPADLLAGMLKVRDFQQGYLNSRQLTFGLFDLTIHTAEGAVDVTEAYKKTFKEVIGVDPIETSHFPASFGHLMGGYDAGYYGYMWSNVYAQDMFTRFSEGGLLSPAVGADYRKWILEKGNMADALDLVRGFLGRESNADAFYRMLGISTN